MGAFRGPGPVLVGAGLLAIHAFATLDGWVLPDARSGWWLPGLAVQYSLALAILSRWRSSFWRLARIASAIFLVGVLLAQVVLPEAGLDAGAARSSSAFLLVAWLLLPCLAIDLLLRSVAADEGLAPPAPPPPAIRAGEHPASGAPAILLVSSDADALAIMRLWLSVMTTARVAECASAVECLAGIERARPQLVFVKRMQALQEGTAERIHARAGWQDIPVVAWTVVLPASLGARELEPFADTFSPEFTRSAEGAMGLQTDHLRHILERFLGPEQLIPVPPWIAIGTFRAQAAKVLGESRHVECVSVDAG